MSRPFENEALLCAICAALAALLGACSFDSERLGSSGWACDSQSDCPSGQYCVSGVCVTSLASDVDEEREAYVGPPDTDAQSDSDDGDATPDLTSDLTPDQRFDLSTDIEPDLGQCDGEPANQCGGCTDLPAAVGSTCGNVACGSGTWQCATVNTLTCVSDDDVNACGGCDELSDAPGDVCQECGEFQCGSDGNSLSCGGPNLNVCGGCEELEGEPDDPCGCGGTYECDDEGSLVCVGSDETN
ncbi:MAG: hypothetical protein KC561_17105, partial [Myxococcales bacterium]|nr:hypothetical protein [Myxococcales bacterium]